MTSNWGIRPREESSALMKRANNLRLDGWERAQAVGELARRLEAAERELDELKALVRTALRKSSCG